jgi:hypothetical protein
MAHIVIDLRDVHQPGRPASKKFGHSPVLRNHPKCCMDGCTDTGNFFVFGPKGHNHYCQFHAMSADQRRTAALESWLDRKNLDIEADDEYDIGKDE